MSDPARLRVNDDTHILVLTGAGVSAESGVPTFRSGGGLWESFPVDQVATPEGFEADPALVWRFYSARRAQALGCAPNPGHVALAALERRLGERFLLVTQNVDALHRRAGSRRLIELHGCLLESRCHDCDRPGFADDRTYDDGPPACDRCASRGRTGRLRPNVVWFGELLDANHLRAIDAFVMNGRRRLVFVAAGTSGAVYPAASLVDLARAAGGETWLINVEPADNSGRFHYYVEGKSGEILPGLFDLG